MPRDLWYGALAVGIYFAVGKLALAFAFEQANTSAVWPSSGLAIGGLVVFGLRFWPAVPLGVLAVTLTIEPLNIGGTLAITFGNTLEAVVGAMLINRFADGKNCMRSASRVFRFILFGAILPPVLSAGIGVTGLVVFIGMPWSEFGEICFTWYTGNCAGILVFAPLVLLWSAPRQRWGWNRILEGIVFLAVLFVVGQAICGVYFSAILAKWPSVYLVIPVMLWAPFRFGRTGTVVALIVFTVIAVAGTVRGFEAFPGNTPNLSLLYLQIFLSVVAMMSLVVAGLISELRQVNESLEETVAERTGRLEKLVREKDDLMAIAAHDLKAPLAGMRNLLQLVRSRPEPLAGESADRALRELEGTADGMLGLVSSLLVAQSAEEVGKNLTIVPCDAVELLGRMVGISRQVAKSKAISIRMDAPGKLMITTHPESFSQIASNLLSNAVKFSPEGESIHVTLEVEPGDRSIILQVRDKGPGINPDERNMIFDKFFRTGNRATGGEPSHGIGLYIVDRLVTALAGKVEYADAEGGGSQFTVTLPK